MATKIPAKTFFNILTIVGRGFDATSDFDTDGMDMRDYNQGWLVYVKRTTAVGNPRWTIEHSFDDVDYDEYDDLAKNLTIPDNVRQERFFPNFIRIKYEANGATGFVTLVMIRTNTV